MVGSQDSYRIGFLKLLEIKDSDIRGSILRQGMTAVDKGVHIGGAFSVTIPMVALFYGDIMNLDVESPTRIGQDMFVLSKGHAVAAMAAVYADLGYFDTALLENSRSEESLLNGHPGPLLPGVHVATGPLGQGVAVAQGFAMTGKNEPRFNVFCITGDGELQEGVVWEAIMYAPQRRLDNLCMIVDKNEGQLDTHSQLIFPMHNLPAEIESFGWNVYDVDGTSYDTVLEAMERFKYEPSNGKPTAIICNTRKGFGAFSSHLNLHKVSLPESIGSQEIAQQETRRQARVDAFLGFEAGLRTQGDTTTIERLRAAAESMGLKIDSSDVAARPRPIRTTRAAVRDKAIRYNPSDLPELDPAKEYSAGDIVTACMKVFARDPRVVSVDADLGSTSGLESGIAPIDQNRAINIGIAESNMMAVGESYAALGYNAWVSTFCPFFDWKVLRRTAVGQQERLEDIASTGGWLSEGHGLDLTYLATAANLDTKTNGSTHMGNDDSLLFSAIAGLNIIDVSCPNQLIAIMKWIMAGNRGLNYVRIMRASSAVVYPDLPEFEIGKAYTVSGTSDDDVHLISSGRGVHEAIAAARLLSGEGVSAEVIDMPSVDRDTLLSRATGKGVTVIVEQNNGYLWRELGKAALDRGAKLNNEGLVGINTRRSDGSLQFIHSATYEQLIEGLGLSPDQIFQRVKATLERIR